MRWSILRPSRTLLIGTHKDLSKNENCGKTARTQSQDEKVLLLRRETRSFPFALFSYLSWAQLCKGNLCSRKWVRGGFMSSPSIINSTTKTQVHLIWNAPYDILYPKRAQTHTPHTHNRHTHTQAHTHTPHVQIHRLLVVEDIGKWEWGSWDWGSRGWTDTGVSDRSMSWPLVNLSLHSQLTHFAIFVMSESLFAIRSDKEIGTQSALQSGTLRKRSQCRSLRPSFLTSFLSWAWDSISCHLTE